MDLIISKISNHLTALHKNVICLYTIKLFYYDLLGTKLFVKPSQKSNRSIIHNAISHCCLAGSVNQEIKNKVLDVSTYSNNSNVKFNRSS